MTGAKDEGEGPEAVGLSESGKSRGGGREMSMSAHIVPQGNTERVFKETVVEVQGRRKMDDEISSPGGRWVFFFARVLIDSHPWRMPLLHGVPGANSSSCTSFGSAQPYSRVMAGPTARQAGAFTPQKPRFCAVS